MPIVNFIADEVKLIVNNVITRLEYHLCKVLCHLRSGDFTSIFALIS